MEFKMETIECREEDEPDPKSKRALEREVKRFREDVIMISQVKRLLLRRKLKKEKVRLLYELMEVKRKLKILDELDEKEKKEKEE
jgi:hypothetical protein